MIPASKLSPGVQRDLFLLGYKNIFASGVSGVVVATFLGAALWSMRHSNSVLIWMACAYVTNSFAWYLFFAFRKDAASTRSTDLDTLNLKRVANWRNLHTLFVIASACVWASICALLDVSDPRSNVLILVSVLAVLAFSASSHGVHNILSYLLSAVISMPIILLYLPKAFQESVLPIAVLFCMFAVACTLIAINAHRTMIDAIELRLSNGELAMQYAIAAKQADQANKDKSNFLAAAAHDMRQPVHSLLMLQGLLRQNTQQSNQGMVLDQMQAATSTIGQLFDSVMEFSRLESGSTLAHLEPIHIESFLTSRVAQHLPMAAEKGLRIRIRKSSTAIGAWVNADRVLLMRLMDNLITNAIRYTHKGGLLICLRKHSARKVYLDIWDTGVGIAMKDVDRVFEPYVQLGNDSRNRDKGLGLGLSIVKSCAELMATPLSLASKFGKGTRFRIQLSRIGAPTLPTKNLEVDTAPRVPISFARLRILLLEDDPMVSNAMHAVLTSWGAEVKHAMSYLELNLGGWVPDLIICDYRLPGGMDGLATLDLLRGRFPRVPCLLQTGEIAPDIPLRAQSSGYGVLVKPITVEILAAAIQKALV
jgi:two-component system, sensor histidine kinase